MQNEGVIIRGRRRGGREKQHPQQYPRSCLSRDAHPHNVHKTTIAQSPTAPRRQRRRRHSSENRLNTLHTRHHSLNVKRFDNQPRLDSVVDACVSAAHFLAPPSPCKLLPTQKAKNIGLAAESTRLPQSFDAATWPHSSKATTKQMPNTATRNHYRRTSRATPFLRCEMASTSQLRKR